MPYVLSAGLIGCLLILIFILVRHFRRYRSHSHAASTGTPHSAGEKVRTADSFDLEIVKIIGAVAATLSILLGLLKFIEGQRERAENEIQAEYIRATQLLAESGDSRPMAGIIAMSQLAEKNSERTWQMTESLSAFVRYTTRVTQPQIPLVLRASYPPCNARDPQTNGAYYSRVTPSLLYQTKPAVQMALNALGYRAKENETRDNAPPRMHPQLNAANLPRDLNGQTGQEWLRSGIDTHWYRSQTTANLKEFSASEIEQLKIDDLPNLPAAVIAKLPADTIAKLINELQYAVGSALPEVMNRPWLDLSHTDLAGLELSYAFLEGGYLHDVDLSASDLAFASLAKARLSESRILKTRLFHADLRGANLQCSDLKGSDLGQADLQETWMSGGNFSQANFWHADLNGGYLVLADMTNLDTMAGANLDNVVAFGADFSKANISPAADAGVSMRHAFLKKATFQSAHLRGVDLRDAQLQGADLRGAELGMANLERANLSAADLRGVDLTQIIGMPSAMTDTIVNDETKMPTGLQAKFGTQLHRTVGAPSNHPARHN